jgi:hypothetical protein
MFALAINSNQRHSHCTVAAKNSSGHGSNLNSQADDLSLSRGMIHSLHGNSYSLFATMYSSNNTIYSLNRTMYSGNKNMYCRGKNIYSIEENTSFPNWNTSSRKGNNRFVMETPSWFYNYHHLQN